MMNKNILTTMLLACGLFGLTSCATSGNAGAYSETPIQSQSLASNSTLWQENAKTIWEKIQHTPLPKMQSSVSQTTDPTIAGWLKLGIISKQYSTNSKELTTQLIVWRKEYPNHPGNSLFPDDTTLSTLQNASPPQRIALLLPLQGPYAQQGKKVRDGFLSAYYDYLAKNNNQQVVSFYDTNQKSISAVYQQALSAGADFIVGPLMKPEVEQLLAQGSFPIPTLSLNYTDIGGFGSLPSQFYEFGLSPNDEGQQLATKAWQAGYRRAILIAPQGDWGQRITKPVLTEWNALGGKIVDSFYYSPNESFTQSIANLLHVNVKEDRAKMRNENNTTTLEQQRRQDFDVIFLLADPENGRQIVPLLNYYYLGHIPIYSTSAIYAGTPSEQKDADLNGVIFPDLPWILTTNGHFDRLYAVGRDAFLLTHELPRLRQLPNFPIYAATGALTLTPQQQVYRRLPWTQMHVGHP